jgi:hypothetical protein
MLAESMESKVFNLSSDDEICKETSIGCKVICNSCSSKCQIFRIPSTPHYGDQLENCTLHQSARSCQTAPLTSEIYCVITLGQFLNQSMALQVLIKLHKGLLGKCKKMRWLHHMFILTQ